MAYVDSKTYTSPENALVRACLHINAHAAELRRANIIYQGKNVHKVVRRIALIDDAPAHGHK